MRCPNFNEENKLRRRGYKRVVGLDEAGRGPLAGPVLAAAVFIRRNPKSNIYNLASNIKDSKKLAPKKREEVYEMLKESPEIEWGIGRVSERVIDRINILEATKLAMKKAVKNLGKKLQMGLVQKIRERGFFAPVDFLILDGNFKINSTIPQKSIIKADEKVFSCASASIVAKVTRDRMMVRYHKKYPRYGFDRHKGYPTKLHRQIIREYGTCQIHRRSFRLS